MAVSGRRGLLRHRTWVALGLLGAMALAAPWPHHAVLQGVLWAPALAQVRAQADGDVEAALVREGEIVRLGQPLFRMRTLSSGLPAAASDAAAAYVSAHASGEFVRAGWRDMGPQPVSRGTLLGYVLSPAPSTVRVWLPAADLVSLQEHAWRWRVMLDERPGVVLGAHVVPGSFRPVLSPATPPRWFTADIVLEERIGRVGGRVTVRADLPARTPLQAAWQWLTGPRGHAPTQLETTG